ncbi:hypothetical protein J6590_037276 [Homalodisca vitripennis]|nr:hypothetical protein J6590_037276 [Homalodisca vitripennis]
MRKKIEELLPEQKRDEDWPGQCSHCAGLKPVDTCRTQCVVSDKCSEARSQATDVRHDKAVTGVEETNGLSACLPDNSHSVRDISPFLRVCRLHSAQVSAATKIKRIGTVFLEHDRTQEGCRQILNSSSYRDMLIVNSTQSQRTATAQGTVPQMLPTG